jgi:hypothetical protein
MPLLIMITNKHSFTSSIAFMSYSEPEKIDAGRLQNSSIFAN